MDTKRGRPPKYLVEHLEQVKQDLDEIKTVLKGYNGNVGLCKQVENHTKSLNKIWIVLAIIAASTSGTGFTIWKVLIG